MGILFSYLPPFALFTRPIEYPCYQAEKRLRYIFYRSLSRHIFKIKRHNFRNPVSYNSFYNNITRTPFATYDYYFIDFLTKNEQTGQHTLSIKN